MAQLITIAPISFRPPGNFITVGSTGSGLNHVTHPTQGPKYCFSSSLSMIEHDWASTIRESVIECTHNSIRRFSPEPKHVNSNSRTFSSSISLALAISNYFYEQVHFICFKIFHFAQIFIILAIFPVNPIILQISPNLFISVLSIPYQTTCKTHTVNTNKPISVNQDLLCMKIFCRILIDIL